MRFLLNQLRRLRPKPQPFLRSILEGERFVAVDVGAAHGLPAHWLAFDGNAHVYAFEPHPESCKALKAHFGNSRHPELYTVLPVALSGTGGTRTLYLTNAPTSSSILQPRIDIAKGYARHDSLFPCREVSIETRTLADVLDEQQEPIVDAIKLDIQGADLEVLEGLGPRLEHLLLAELEVGLNQYYHGQPGFGDVDRALKQVGMLLFDVRVSRAHLSRDGDPAGYQERVFSVYHNSPAISARALEFDVVYFRDPGALLQAKDRAAVTKLAGAYCVYHFYAEAYDLICRAQRRGIFTMMEASALQDRIVAWHRALHYRFYHRPAAVFNLFRRALRFLRVDPYLRWAQYTYVDYPSC